MPRRFHDIVHIHALHHFTQLTSCVGDNSCGTDSGTLYYGATVISSDDGARRAKSGEACVQLGASCH